MQLQKVTSWQLQTPCTIKHTKKSGHWRYREQIKTQQLNSKINKGGNINVRNIKHLGNQSKTNDDFFKKNLTQLYHTGRKFGVEFVKHFGWEIS